MSTLTDKEQRALEAAEGRAAFQAGAEEAEILARAVRRLDARVTELEAKARELDELKRPWTDQCDQCGARRGDWQDPNDPFCPNHAVPEPYSSCDGLLKPAAAIRARVTDLEALVRQASGFKHIAGTSFEQKLLAALSRGGVEGPHSIFVKETRATPIGGWPDAATEKKEDGR